MTVALSSSAKLKKRFCVGLTGGLASGKGVVAELFAELGADIVDADEIARELTVAGGGAMPAVRRKLGEWAADESGALRREEVRARIFADAGLRARLEAVLHPRIRAGMLRRIAAGKGAYCVAVVPLLFESGMLLGEVSRAVVVDCPRKTQIARALRRGWSGAQIAAILAAQLPCGKRRALADDSINNGSDAAPPLERVRRLHQMYLRLSQQQQQPSRR